MPTMRGPFIQFPIPHSHFSIKHPLQVTTWKHRSQNTVVHSLKADDTISGKTTMNQTTWESDKTQITWRPIFI